MKIYKVTEIKMVGHAKRIEENAMPKVMKKGNWLPKEENEVPGGGK
jgi:hypothetical protein